jgi:hypothetical protein
MEKKDIPFRLVFFVIMTIIVLSCLIWLNFKSPIGIVNTLTTIGICFGVGWLIILFGTIYYLIDERKKRIIQAQEPERLKQHQARFYCHICGKPSPKPYQYWDDDGENGQIFSSLCVVDYNTPTELVQCAQCHKWTCPNADPPHLENGVCKKCLEHRPE